MIILVTGGQRSGKSSYAESLLAGREGVVYIATAKADGKEMQERIRLHQMSRPKEWRTLERYQNFVDEDLSEDNYLLECVGTMTSNIMFDRTQGIDFIDKDLAKEVEDEVFNNLRDLIEKIKEEDKTLVLVTNEVGFSLTSENHLGRVYTDILGRLNQRLARLADQVYLVVAGIEVRVK